MNREILFRGKRCSDGKWVYGFYVESKQSWQGHKPHRSWIVPNAISNGGFFNVLGRYAVKDDTVGQFVGMTDKRGVKVFEGDIVDVYDFTSVYASKYRGVVKMYRGSWCVEYEDSILDMVAHPRLFFDDFADRKTDVIGNIHDNFELLAAKQS